MLACDVEVSKLDPCLFVGDKVICLCYVDDILFGSSDIAFTNKLAAKLCAKELLLEQEDDTAGFLGVCLHKNGQSLIEMKQTGLIDCDIEILGLDTRISIPPNGFLLSPNHWYVTMLEKWHMVTSATAALLECYSTSQGIFILIFHML